jgi:hypothetical protein
MMKLQDVILKPLAKRITWMAAAEIAGVSDRTMRRIKQRYEEFGYDGLFDAARRLTVLRNRIPKTRREILGELRTTRQPLAEMTPGEPLRRRPAA